MKTSEVKVGKIFKTTYGQDMLVTNVINWEYCEIEFQDEFKFKRTIAKSSVRSGHVRNPYHRRVYGVGFMGVGEYNSKDDKRAYRHWSGMLDRCYNSKNNAYTRYGQRGVSVCDEWHCFQNFANWFYQQSEFYGEGYHLDKDLMKYFNKTYSPDTCVLVPKELNSMFTVYDTKETGLPVGVTKESHNGRNYRAAANGIKLGSFHTAKEAFIAYKTYKEAQFKVLAENMKGRIPDRAYKRLHELRVDPVIPTMDWKLDIISKEHFEILSNTGLLHELYPDIPSWKECEEILKGEEEKNEL